jgi:hypothetical protein
MHELSEFAGPLTAEITGTPHATYGYGPLLEPEIADVAEASAAEHYLAAGLAPSAARLYRSLYLDPCPPSLQVPAVSEIERRIAIRPEPAIAALGPGKEPADLGPSPRTSGSADSSRTPSCSATVTW